MRCVLCNRPGITEGEEALGLCEVHDAGFRQEAREAAEALDRGDDGAEAKAASILNNRIRLTARVVLSDLPARFRRLGERHPAAEQQQQEQPRQPGVLNLEE